MSVVDDSQTRAAMTAPTEQDLGPLAWVLDELRKSLEAATKAVGRFVRDADAARVSDLETLDTSALRIARQQLHQAGGALEMVGLSAPAQVLRSMETAVNRFVQRPELCSNEAAATLERTHFALMEYLEAVLAGKRLSAVALFPQYRDTQALAGNDKVHPADLWPAERRAREPRWGSVIPEPLEYGPNARALLDGVVLRMVKSDDREAAAQMRELCLRFAAALTENVSARSFWKIAAAFFDAQAHGLIVIDLFVKRMASRVLMQYASMAKGDTLPPARLLQDLMFFCAQAKPRDQAGDALKAVQEAYSMAAMPLVDYQVARFGRYDPAVLIQARKRIATAAETWSSLAGGDRSKIKPTAEQFGLVAESLVKLQPSSHGLARILIRVAETVERIGEPPPAELAMEVATAVLYLQATFATVDHEEDDLARQSSSLVHRLDAALQGAPAQPLEAWMEELYRQASDHQTMGSVVGELRSTMAEAEKHLDQYFRDPADASVLAPVPGQMAQMRGVLSVLGFDQAAIAMQRMRDTVERLMLGEVAEQDRIKVFEKLGNSIGAMGFLIDMLSYQRNMARKLFVYDEEQDELRIVMGRNRVRAGEAFRPTVDIPTELEPVAAKVESVQMPVQAPVQTQAPIPAPAPAPAPVTVPAPAPAALDVAVEQTPEVIAQEVVAVVAPQVDITHTQLAFVEPVAVEPVTVEPLAVEPVALAAALPEVPAKLEAAPNADSDALADAMAQVLAGMQLPADAVPASPAVQALAQEPGIEHTQVQHSDSVAEVPAALAEDATEALAPAHVANLLDAASLHLSEPLVTLPEAVAPVPAAVAQPVELTSQELEGDDELLGIFLEEAREVVETGLQALQVLADEPDNLSEQTTLRRAFHTLKGSSRMVGLDEFGEASWSMEQMLNAWLAEQQPMPVPMQALATDALKAFGAWAQHLEMRQADAWSATPFRAAADAMRLHGERAEVALVPRRERQIEPVAEFAELQEQAADQHVVVTEALVPEPEVAAPLESAQISEADFSAALVPENHIPSEDLAWPFDVIEETPSASVAPHEAVAESADLLPELDFDLPGTEWAAKTEPVAEHDLAELSFELAVEPVEPVEVASSSAVEEIDFDAFELAMRESEQASFESQTHEPEAVQAEHKPDDVAHEHAAELVVEPEPLAIEAPAVEEDTKNIDGLRINTPLYNVYLNEADEWSSRLEASLQHWVSFPHESIPEDAVALAHSLAGSSATVGFKALSELSRLLEHALQHLQPQNFATPEQAQQCLDASDEIRRLLHQFAAGFLKTPAPAVEEALRGILEQEVVATDAVDHSLDDELEGPDSGWSGLQEVAPAADPLSAPLDFTAQVSELNEAEEIHALPDAPEAAEPHDAAPEVELKSEPLVQEEQAAEQSAPTAQVPQEEKASTDSVLNSGTQQLSTPALYSAMPRPVDAEQEADLQRRIDEAIALAVNSDMDEDDIDVLDQVDPDLFPIFEEEAIELLPKLGAALRRWHGRPTLDDARNETLRALHTLKGSARLAGAMRLGEMAHRLESAVERIDSEKPTAEGIEPLLNSFDAMQASFDVLRVAGEQVEEPPLSHMDDAIAQAPLHLSAMAAAAAANAQAESASVTAAPGVPPAAPKAFASAAASIVLPTVPVQKAGSQHTVRVRALLLDRLISQAGEVLIARSRVDARLVQARSSLNDLSGNLERLRTQLRDIEVQAESQMQSRLALSKDTAAGFDPLEFDRFTRVQELTRMMAESVNDVATVQRNLQRELTSAEDDLVAQGRQARDLQRDLLRTRMVEFDSLAERLYAVVRQTSKEMGKQVRLNILGGTIEMDRGMLERMMPAFEHLLRNCVAHGIELPEVRQAAGKPAVGTIEIILSQERNDVALSVEDDGAGLNLERIRAKAIGLEMWTADQFMSMEDAGRLIFEPGFSTATEITGVAGRGIGMDVVRSEVNALGGRIETHSEEGRGSAFRLVVPLTTAVTQVVMLRVGNMSVGVPANLVEIVRRTPLDALDQAYRAHEFHDSGEVMPFYWAGALWQSSLRSDETVGRTRPVVIVRSASQRIALHVDEVLGNQEVVIKNLGPQLARLPGLTGMSVLPSGAVVQIYNPVALANVYGTQVRAMVEKAERAAAEGKSLAEAGDGSAGLLSGDVQASVPLVLVVDDSITVRRVTQRLLQREGYRVTLASDGLQALERLQDERPTVVLSDIEMPRMDGFDLLRNIRADHKLTGMPVIMITSRIAQKHREMATQLGANHYLGKPYSDEELLGLIQHYALQRSGPAPERYPLSGGPAIGGEASAE